MTGEQRAIHVLIRASDVGQYLVEVGVDPDPWAKFQAPDGGFFTVRSESDNDSTAQLEAADLIGQARARISN